MAESVVGYRFCPTDEELINYYLMNKIMDKTWLVEEEISEINNIYTKEPMLLPSLAKIQLDHLHRPVWYFFSPKEYTSPKKNITERTTGSGYWKVTGIDQKIRDKRGNGVEIGIKKTLVYYQGKVPQGIRSPWAMHEYHITSLPLPPNHKSTYVICQVMYKGDKGEISNGNQLSESSHSLVIDPKTVGGINTPSDVEQSSREDGLYMKDFLIQMEGKDDRCANENVVSDQENHNDHRPKKPLSGIIVDDSSDHSDGEAESISAMSYQGTWSPVDGVGSSEDSHSTSFSSTDSCKDLQTCADPSVTHGARYNQNKRF